MSQAQWEMKILNISARKVQPSIQLDTFSSSTPFNPALVDIFKLRNCVNNWSTCSDFSLLFWVHCVSACIDTFFPRTENRPANNVQKCLNKFISSPPPPRLDGATRAIILLLLAFSALQRIRLRHNFSHPPPRLPLFTLIGLE